MNPELQDLIDTADNFGNLMPSVIFTMRSGLAVLDGYVETVETPNGLWQRLTVKGMKHKFGSSENENQTQS
jgi:hypothetical protein